MAFDSGGEMTSHYPDIEAGEIIGVSGQECGLLESIYESYFDEQAQSKASASTFLCQALRGVGFPRKSGYSEKTRYT
jgi:hypothetical protein